MGKIRRYKNVIERFLSGESGQRFFNVAYSVGAAIVILGTLFKILHLSGGDILLSLGMGTEVVMFILTAFDRPPRETSVEELIPYLTGERKIEQEGDDAPAAAPQSTGVAQGPIIVQGSGGVVGSASAVPTGSAPVVSGGQPSGAVGGTVILGGGAVAAAPAAIEGTEEMADSVKKITESLDDYLGKMTDLNRNIAGLNTMYELQLRGVSGQLDAFDSVSRGMKEMRQMYEETAARSAEYREEARQLTLHMHQLNVMYERMIQAMTHNQAAQGIGMTQPESNNL